MLFIVTIDNQLNIRTFGCSQHHDAHDAFSVHALAVLGNIHITGKCGGRRDEFCRCPCVQAELVDDFDVLPDQSGLSVEFTVADLNVRRDLNHSGRRGRFAEWVAELYMRLPPAASP